MTNSLHSLAGPSRILGKALWQWLSGRRWMSPGSSINTQRASFSGQNVKSINVEGSLHAGEVDLHLGGQVDSVTLSQVRGGWDLARLRFFGEDGPGSELTVNTLDVEGRTSQSSWRPSAPSEIIRRTKVPSSLEVVGC